MTLTQAHLYRSFLTMIKWTRQCQEKYSKKSFPSKSWAKEVSTVKFCVPRQSGHTTFIKRIIGNKWFGEFNGLFKKPALIFPFEGMILSTGLAGQKWVGSVQNLNKFYGEDWDAVIVDCTSLLSSKQIDSIYDTFTRCPDIIFIFVE